MNLAQVLINVHFSKTIEMHVFEIEINYETYVFEDESPENIEIGGDQLILFRECGIL
jgi:hypothetical protein